MNYAFTRASRAPCAVTSRPDAYRQVLRSAAWSATACYSSSTSDGGAEPAPSTSSTQDKPLIRRYLTEHKLSEPAIHKYKTWGLLKALERNKWSGRQRREVRWGGHPARDIATEAHDPMPTYTRRAGAVSPSEAAAAPADRAYAVHVRRAWAWDNGGGLGIGRKAWERYNSTPHANGKDGLTHSHGQEPQWALRKIRFSRKSAGGASHKAAFSSVAALAAKRRRGAKPPSGKRHVAPAHVEKSKGAPPAAKRKRGAKPPSGKRHVAPARDLTWRDFDPEAGIPLPFGELDAPAIEAALGPGTPVDIGNYALSVMLYRRVSGSIVNDGLDFPEDSGVGREMAQAALAYARSLDAEYDENGAAENWAEEEAAKLEAGLIASSEALGLYKKVDSAAEEDVHEVPEQDIEELYIPGESVIIQIRKRNIALNARREKAAAAAAAAARDAELLARPSPTQPTGLEPTGPGALTLEQARTNASLAPVVRKPWVDYYKEQALITKDPAVPQLSLLARLGPAALVTLAVLALCLFLSTQYVPPPRAARMRPDTPPALATLQGLTAVLCVMFVAARLPWLWRAFNKWFTIVPGYPYAVSVVGAGLRHDTPMHLASNLVWLWLFGLMLHEDVGRGTFLAVYVASSCVGGYASLAYNVLNRQWMTYIFGSSGGVVGVVAAACALHPNGKLSMFGIEVPIAAWVFLALYSAADIVAAVRMKKTTIDHAGHVGGLVSGIAWALYLKRRAAAEAQKGDVRGEAPAAAEREAVAEAFASAA